MKIFYALLLLTTIYSCADNGGAERADGFSHLPATAEDSLFQDVMQRHDTAMAKMGRIRRLRQEISDRLDSLEALPGKAEQAVREKLQALDNELESAEEGMNRWMEEFNIDSAADNLKARLEYLRDEKFRVEKVRDDIFRALDKADSLLRN